MEQDKGFKNKLDDTLNEIEDSLEDIKNRTYGICKICDKYIDEERLQLIPYLKTCIDCSNDEELPKDFRQFETIDEKKMVSFSMEPRENVGFDRKILIKNCFL